MAQKYNEERERERSSASTVTDSLIFHFDYEKHKAKIEIKLDILQKSVVSVSVEDVIKGDQTLFFLHFKVTMI